MKKEYYKTEIVFFVLIHFFICCFILHFSPVVQLAYGHDITPVLDGAWRLDNGQLPHKDFSSILGYSYLLQQFIFLKLFSNNFIAFSVSSIITSTVTLVCFLCFYNSDYFRNNTSRLLRIYFFLIIVAVGLGQYNFGTLYLLTTYANLYNRYCFLYLFIIFILSILLSKKKYIDTKVLITVFVIACLINYLLFCKITYFAVAVSFITLLCILRLIPLKTYGLLTLAILIICCIILFLSGESLIAIFLDYKTISHARAHILLSKDFLASKLLNRFIILYLITLLAAIFQLIKKKVSYKIILIILFISGSSIFIHFTNWGWRDIVLLTFMPVVFILIPQYTKLISFKIFLLLSTVFIGKNLISIYCLTTAKNYPYQHLQNKYVSGFYTDWYESTCSGYVVRTMSGVNLIDSNKQTNDRVFAFAFDNPFPVLTHTIPPRNVPIVWQAGTTYSYNVHPSAKNLFSNVSLLMISKCEGAEAAKTMNEIYGEAVKAHFKIIAQNEYWLLYRKVSVVL